MNALPSGSDLKHSRTRRNDDDLATCSGQSKTLEKPSASSSDDVHELELIQDDMDGRRAAPSSCNWCEVGLAAHQPFVDHTGWHPSRNAPTTTLCSNSHAFGRCAASNAERDAWSDEQPCASTLTASVGSDDCVSESSGTQCPVENAKVCRGPSCVVEKRLSHASCVSKKCKTHATSKNRMVALGTQQQQVVVPNLWDRMSGTLRKHRFPGRRASHTSLE